MVAEASWMVLRRCEKKCVPEARVEGYIDVVPAMQAARDAK